MPLRQIAPSPLDCREMRGRDLGKSDLSDSSRDEMITNTMISMAQRYSIGIRMSDVLLVRFKMTLQKPSSDTDLWLFSGFVRVGVKIPVPCHHLVKMEVAAPVCQPPHWRASATKFCDAIFPDVASLNLSEDSLWPKRFFAHSFCHTVIRVHSQLDFEIWENTVPSSR